MKTQKSFLGSNLKHLRERMKKTQLDIAETLKVTRAKINAFENEVNINPTVEDLFKFTSLFKISADSLLWTNLKRLTELQLRNLEAGNDEYIRGTKIRVLATTTDSHNEENIELVSKKVKAGYLTGFKDPEFISKLPIFNLPMLPSNKKFRVFPVEGDSMKPFPSHNVWVICEYIENWMDTKENQKYVVISKEADFSLKLIENKIKHERKIILKSLNPVYSDFSLQTDEIQEIWQFKGYIHLDWPEYAISIKELDEAYTLMKDTLLNKIA
jgi:transcriptional regulator with XRE-family HTH domain